MTYLIRSADRRMTICTATAAAAAIYAARLCGAGTKIRMTDCNGVALDLDALHDQARLEGHTSTSAPSAHSL